MKTNKFRLSLKTMSIIVLVVLAGGGIIYYLAKCYGQTMNPTLSNTPIKVKVVKAEKYDDNESFSYSGTIEEAESVPLSFSVNGTVLKVLVDNGDLVKEGQLLAVLNDATYSNINEMSKAMLDRAEDAYKRLKPMYESGSLPEIKFVEVETSLDQARATLAISQKNLDDCKLYSPIDGYVGTRSIEPGMNVLPGITAINIVKIDKILARIAVSENEIARIRNGQKAVVTIGALRHREFVGQVEEIGVVADPIVHTYKIKIAIPNKDHSMKPGMICEARIQTSEMTGGVIIPTQAVQVDEDGRKFVFGVEINQDRVLRKYVEIGRLVRDGIEIKSGLGEGEQVVVAGQQKLVDNSPIEIIN